MSLKKQYMKSKPVCKVTFTLPEAMANSAEKVSLVGDFNDWNPGSNPMKRRKDGGFDTTITIPAGREYQYRYLLDGIHWENDDRADRYVRSPYGDSDNSVVSV